MDENESPVYVFVQVLEVFLFIVCLYLAYKGCKEEINKRKILSDKHTVRSKKVHREPATHIQQSTQESPPKYHDIVHNFD